MQKEVFHCHGVKILRFLFRGNSCHCYILFFITTVGEYNLFFMAVVLFHCRCALHSYFSLQLFDSSIGFHCRNLSILCNRVRATSIKLINNRLSQHFARALGFDCRITVYFSGNIDPMITKIGYRVDVQLNGPLNKIPLINCI